jgi:outer membrane lipoprotein-sorting protein
MDMDFGQATPYLAGVRKFGTPMAVLLAHRWKHAGLILGLALLGQQALAQGAPTSILPGAPRPGAPATGPILPQPTAPANETPQALTERINRALNGNSTLVGDFTQINADGRRRTGKLYVLRPGKLRFDYNPPSQLEVVSDGSNVAVIDKRVPQQDVYGINQTPLKFLVSDKIDIAKDTKVIGVRRDKDEVILDIEDKNTVAGTSKIRIHFNGETFMLKRWTVTDPQGIPTTVQLANLSTQQRPDRSLFFINYQFNASRPNPN